MAKLLLNVALVDLGRGGKTGAQGMAGGFFGALSFVEITAMQIWGEIAHVTTA